MRVSVADRPSTVIRAAGGASGSGADRLNPETPTQARV